MKIQLNSEQLEKLDEMAVTLNTDLGGVVAKALAFLAVFVRENKEGGQICIVNEAGKIINALKLGQEDKNLDRLRHLAYDCISYVGRANYQERESHAWSQLARGFEQFANGREVTPFKEQ